MITRLIIRIIRKRLARRAVKIAFRAARQYGRDGKISIKELFV